MVLSELEGIAGANTLDCLSFRLAYSRQGYFHFHFHFFFSAILHWGNVFWFLDRGRIVEAKKKTTAEDKLVYRGRLMAFPT